MQSLLKTEIETNKGIVMDLLNAAFKEKNVRLASAMLTDRYIQHNPNVPTGKQGFIEGITALHKMYPKLQWELKNIWGEGEYVIAHSLYRFTGEGPGSAIVDIFRIKDGLADEHWDVAQEIPARMAHDNGMF